MDIILNNNGNGINTYSFIKEKLDIPVIYLTAHTNKELVNKAKNTKPYAYILKPFEEKELDINIQIAIYKHYIDKELENERILNNKIFNSISQGIIVFSNDFQIIIINDYAKNYLNLNKKDSLKNSIKIDNMLLEEIVGGYLYKNKDNNIFFNENRIYFKTTNKNIISNSSISIINKSDFIFIFQDITDIREVKKKVNFIIEDTSIYIRQDFFNKVVEELSKLFEVKYVAIVEKLDDELKVVAGHYKSSLRERDIKNNNFAFLIDLYNDSGYILLENDSEIDYSTIISKYKNLLNFIKQRTSIELERKRFEAELKKKEELYRNLANSIPQVIFEIDKEGNILFLNEQGLKNFNLKKYSNKKIFDFIDKYYLERFRNDINTLIKENCITPSEYKFIKDNNTSYPCILYMNKVNKKVIRGFISDISKLRKNEIALKESEELYSLTLRGINDGFWDWNIVENKVFFSPRWKEIIGYDEDDKIDIDFWFSSIHKDDIENVKNNLNYFINETDLDKIELEYRIRHKNGNYIWVICNINSIRDNNNKAKRIAGYHSDITTHKSKEQLLENLLYNVSHDTLTGLPNRNIFIEKLEKAFSISRNKEKDLFSVLFIDINRFKIINDSLGHSIGDSFLIKVAERLKTFVNENITLSRLGGDDFAILYQNVKNEEEIIKLSKDIIKIMQEPFIINDQEIFTSVSIGISISNNKNNYAEEMLRNADIAMYKAKKTGKNNFEIFNPKMHKITFEILELETDLRNALKKKEFVLNYQPIISLISGKIVGFEALLRWNHGKKGLISSDKFIPIAEETGLIVPIGNWVIKKACKQIKKWQSKFGNLSISVNLSTKQFYYDELVEDIINVLNETKIDPHSLKLEITESSIIESYETVKDILLRLKELNIQIQIDDFGTGYSSLSYLHRFPVNTIKIDKSFISRINIDKENLEIVKTIIALAKNLNMEVIAEGIENKEQLGILRNLDCNYGQGYFFSKPLISDIIEELMLSDPKW